jgi:hypothetical protein
MMQDKKPLIYIVLIGLDMLNLAGQKALLFGFKDRLLTNIRNECHTPWVREHIKDCLVMSVDAWNQNFVDCPVRRLSRLPDEIKLAATEE